MRLLLAILLLFAGLWFFPQHWPLYVLAIAFSPGCNCCGSTCAIFSDTFASLSGWTQTSGSWSASSSTATTGSISAVLLGNTTQAAGTAAMTITASITIGTSGDIARLYVGYKNSTNFCYGEITAGTSGSMSVYQVIGGTPTLLHTISIAVPLTAQTWTLCISGDLNTVTLLCSTFTTTQAYPSVGGDLASFPPGSSGFALGTGATNAGGISFASFTSARTDLSCPPCMGLCPVICTAGTVPAEVEVAFSGIANAHCAFCSDLNSTFICAQAEMLYGFAGDTTRIFACRWDYPITTVCTIPRIIVELNNQTGFPTGLLSWRPEDSHSIYGTGGHFNQTGPSADCATWNYSATGTPTIVADGNSECTVDGTTSTLLSL